MRKTQKAFTLQKKNQKRIIIGGGGYIRRLTQAEQRAQAKFILNNWGL